MIIGCDFVDNLDKVLMFKKDREDDEVNDVYIVIREVDDYYIVKKYDTIKEENKDIIALKKDYVSEELYSLREFFLNANYVGMSGYYRSMNALEKYIMQSLIVVYKDDYNDIVFDQILGNFFVTPALYELDDFVPFEKQNSRVRFKQGLGKNK